MNKFEIPTPQFVRVVDGVPCVSVAEHEALMHKAAAHIVKQEAERHTLQAEGKHPAPCARFCEANAFEIEIRQLKAELRAAQADAARYRWFADVAVSGEFDRAEKAFECFADAESCTKTELDAAIDAAMKESS